MSKESFKQFVKRQEEKLDKAEKMIEEVEGRWKDKIEEFEMVEKSVKELKKLWEENEEETRKQRYNSRASFFFFSSFPLPEVPPSFLERISNFLGRISNRFLKEFDWKKFEKRDYLGADLGLFISAFLKKNIENYISSQKEKGIKEENIKPIEVHLKVKEAPVRFDYLGYQNPKKLHLIIEGNCGDRIGTKMQGGEIAVKGNCEYRTGEEIQGGKIIVEGNCGSGTGRYMQGGKMIVKGDCGGRTGWEMQGGELNIKGKVKSFDDDFTFFLTIKAPLFGEASKSGKMEIGLRKEKKCGREARFRWGRLRKVKIKFGNIFKNRKMYLTI